MDPNLRAMACKSKLASPNANHSASERHRRDHGTNYNENADRKTGKWGLAPCVLCTNKVVRMDREREARVVVTAGCARGGSCLCVPCAARMVKRSMNSGKFSIGCMPMRTECLCNNTGSVSTVSCSTVYMILTVPLFIPVLAILLVLFHVLTSHIYYATPVCLSRVL